VANFHAFLTPTLGADGRLNALVSLPVETATVFSVQKTAWDPEQLRIWWRRRQFHAVENPDIFLRFVVCRVIELLLTTLVTLHETP
jgi:hypothetical protein